MTAAVKDRGGLIAGPGAGRTPIRFAVFAFLFSLPGIGQAEVLPDAEYAALARSVIDQVILPAYSAHARATQRLGPVIERHCMGSAAGDAAAVRTAFDETMDAWQRAWPFAFGPVTSGAGRARIAFWPDRRGSTARQMRAVLRTRDDALLDPERLAGKSVAVKGLQTLERLLFGTPRDTYTCGLAHAIARYQSNLAADVLDAWTVEGGFRDAALAAGGGSDEYADDSEVARDLMRSLTESLEAIIAQKLASPLGESVAKARPKRAESWRSGRSLRNVIVNLESLQALIETPGGFGDLVAAHDGRPLADDLRHGFADALAKARSIPRPLKDAVSDPEERAKLLDLHRSLRALRALVTGPLSRAIGILAGFNAQDGD